MFLNFNLSTLIAHLRLSSSITIGNKFALNHFKVMRQFQLCKYPIYFCLILSGDPRLYRSLSLPVRLFMVKPFQNFKELYDYMAFMYQIKIE